MKERIYRTVLSVAVTVGAVLIVRGTIRAAMARAHRVDRDVHGAEMPIAPDRRVHSLALIVPAELHVNLAGLAIRRRAERLHMPYSLAVDIAEEKAAGANWERLDDETALTIKNLSGMERVYRTPDGSIVLREIRAIKGNDALMEDFAIPASLLPAPEENALPDDLARRAARRVKELLPPVLRDVVVGSPLLTELITRGEGAALIVHCVADMSAHDASRAVEDAARRTGWTSTPFAEAVGGAPQARWTKENLAFHFDAVARPDGIGCDVNYRFTDDETYSISTKGQTNEN